MMQPFDTQGPGLGASAWLRRNASGNCSILMGTSAGVAVYTYWHDNPAGPMIYGPIGYRDEAGKTRIMYRSIMQRQARFNVMERALIGLLNDLRILSGEIVGPSGVSWQDVAGTAALNAQVLADQLTQARAGNSHGPIVFPSPSEAMEKA